MARQAMDAHSDTIEYDRAPIPAVDAELADFGEPEASRDKHDGHESHASFEAHDFGGSGDR